MTRLDSTRIKHTHDSSAEAEADKASGTRSTGATATVGVGVATKEAETRRHGQPVVVVVVVGPRRRGQERVLARPRSCRRRCRAGQPRLSRDFGRGCAQAQVHRCEPCAGHDGVGLRRRRASGFYARGSAEHRYATHHLFLKPPASIHLYLFILSYPVAIRRTNHHPSI